MIKNILKFKYYAVTLLFLLLIGTVTALHIILPDEEISVSERRKKDQFPAFTADSVISGKFMTDFEDYTLDQFPARDSVRTVKSLFNFYVLRQGDNNDVYVRDGQASKLEYPMNESSIISAAEKLETLTAKFLNGGNAYYAVIPDKNYFLAEKNGYPSMDYDALIKLMNDNISSLEYIDIFGTVALDDFYTTDIHWSQEKVLDTAKLLMDKMGTGDSFNSEYEYNYIDGYYGSYFGQAALPIQPDRICYLTSKTTGNASVYNIETEKTTGVYDLDKLSDAQSVDKYDIFLSGASAVLEITNPDAKTDRELVIFRDSFGSSIAPLMLDGYSKITLVDIRYIMSNYVDSFVDFENADILFLYNTIILNNSSMLR